VYLNQKAALLHNCAAKPPALPTSRIPHPSHSHIPAMHMPHATCATCASLRGNKGRQKNKTGKRRTSAPARKKTKVRTYVLVFLVRFWAFLGKGILKTREKN
jgi:hypothetical protein